MTCNTFVYYPSGNFYAKTSWRTATFAEYGTGDTITVRLDLDGSTVAFRKNDVDVGTPQEITHIEDAYYFAFSWSREGNGVTIVEIK